MSYHHDDDEEVFDEDDADQDAISDDEETEESTDTEETEETSGEDIAKVRAENDALLKKNKQLFARLKKKDNPKSLPSDNTGSLEEISKKVETLSQSEAKRQFGYDNSLSPEETDAVFRIKSDPSKEDLKDPFIAGGLKAIRSKNRVASNTPSPSGKMPTIDGKKWDDMDDGERDKNYQKMLKSKVGK